jgi:hypothetical protein
MIYAPGDDQWILGEISYSVLDTGLTGEDVDIFVERGCTGAWEKLGTTRTTRPGEHADVEGVVDEGARVFSQIPSQHSLGLGRHRVRLVVAGDHSSTDLIVDVLPKGTPVFVTDVDGMVASSVDAEYVSLLTGNLPEEVPQADVAMTRLASKGIHAVYVTARPEWLTERTKEFLARYGFPPGVVHTTPTKTGAIGAAAGAWEAAELRRLEAHGVKIVWAFGNQASDGYAFDAAGIEPVGHRVFYQLTDTHGGQRVESFADIIPILSNEAPVCSE